MKTEKEDQRVKFSKMLLEKSLVDLMREYPISKISVKLLCETADINRSTFYSHYTDQYDLLEKLEQKVVSKLEKYISEEFPSNQPEELSLQGLNKILTYMSKNSDLFKILLSENGDSSFQKEIMLIAQQKIISKLNNAQNIDERTLVYLQIFIITGSINMIQKWLQDNMTESTEKMSELIIKLFNNGLSSFVTR